MKNVIILLAVFLVAGCVSNEGLRQLGQEAKESRHAYKECVLANQDNLPKCDALKAAYDADIKAVDVILNGSGQGGGGYSRMGTTCFNSGGTLICN